ncbi:MAG: ubiquinone anaerobic biosynthesis protein UbiV [Alphaproteobacteria bacterium]
MKSQLTIAPILFHWSAEQKLDFYARIADEAPVDVVYLGEVICSKRTPFFEKHYDEVAERLTRAGKTVVFSTLAEVMLKRERNMIAGFCDLEDYELEINDSSALWHLDDKSYRVGSLMNVYNEDTMAYLVAKGATHFSLPSELPRASVAILAARAKELGVTTEVQVFGRVSLALSARCYHARAHGRIKDNCQFVCEEDMNGMPLSTLDKEEFLVVNGIQTLSHTYLNLLGDLDDMKEMGVTHFRLVPHTQDMVAVANIFRDALNNTVSAAESGEKLAALNIPAPFSNGFWHGQAGHQWVGDGSGAIE